MTSQNPALTLPNLVAHADWSANPEKRWMARATLGEDGNYSAHPPEPVGETKTLLHRLSQAARKGGIVLIGFDFPIGLPIQFALPTGIDDFLIMLPKLGQGEWVEFYHVAERPDEISLQRPFYPQRPGGARHAHLIDALKVNNINDLRRGCDLAHPTRRAAAPLFWTLGGQQVGKAAICGWREVLSPGLLDQSLNLVIWPFSGLLRDLLQPGRIVAVETYPAEMYTHLGVQFSPSRRGRKSGKRDQIDRIANAPRLLQWSIKTEVRLDLELRLAIENGFGPLKDGEDPFDAVVGLFGMINLILGHKKLEEPQDKPLRKIEGWIFGQPSKKNGLFYLFICEFLISSCPISLKEI